MHIKKFSCLFSLLILPCLIQGMDDSSEHPPKAKRARIESSGAQLIILLNFHKWAVALL